MSERRYLQAEQVVGWAPPEKARPVSSWENVADCVCQIAVSENCIPDLETCCCS